MRMLYILSTLLLISAFCWSKPQCVGNTAILLKYINEYRRLHGLNALIYDKTLEEASKLQAVYDCETYSNYPISSNHALHENTLYPQVRNRLDKVGYKFNSNFSYWYENAIRYNKLTKDNRWFFDIDKQIFEDYKNSLSHNETMLNKCSTKIGIYTVYDAEKECLYNVIVFAN